MEECSEDKFCDDTVSFEVVFLTHRKFQFDIGAPENADGNFERLPEEAHFINDGLDADDISQGGLGKWQKHVFSIFCPQILTNYTR